MLVNWKCAVASKFRGRATKSNQTWAKQRLLRLVRASSNFLTVRTRGRVSPLGFLLASFSFEFSVFQLFIPIFSQRRQEGCLSFVIPTCIFNSSRLFKCSSIFSSSGSGFIQKETFSRETRSWNSPTANYNPVLSSLPFPLPRCRHLGEHTNTQNMIYRDTEENCYISLMFFGNRCLCTLAGWGEGVILSFLEI